VATRIRTIALFLFGAAVFAQAGSLAISPVRVDLSEAKLNSTVQVTNSGDEPITVQVHAASWRTEGAEDSYFETNDVVVNPPVFTLAAGQKQIIRLGLRSRDRIEIERSYRLILEEVPKPPKPGTIGTVLRISLPIFQVPRRPVAPILIWQAGFTDDGALKISVRNDGSAHDRIKELVIEVGAERIPSSLSAYVLPGGRRDFVIRDERLRGAAHIGIETVTDTGKGHEELTPQPN
jgi:fimbrial chaperone protein